MRNFLSLIFIFLFVGLGSRAEAEREVHVVAVGKGQPSNNVYALPEVHVLVDRPGHEVGLVLLDGGDLSWHIETTDGTFITEIVRSGPSPRDSEVLLSGAPVFGVDVAGLPLVFNPWGRDFRTLMDDLAQRMGTLRIQSFQGTHIARNMPLRVDQIDDVTAALARDYLSTQIETASDLPAELKSWLANDESRDESRGAYTVEFGSTGISLMGPSGTQYFPVSASVPDIFLPVTGVYAPDVQKIFGLTYGADGFVYSVDVKTGKWDVITNLRGYDAASLLYDAKSHRLIMTGAFSRPGEIKTLGLDGSETYTFIPILAFPGLSDLFDFGNEYGPPLIPRVFAGNWLLLEARGEKSATIHDTIQRRIYAVQVETKEVRLINYSDLKTD